MSNSKVKNPAVVKLGKNREMVLEHIPTPTIEADQVVAQAMPNASTEETTNDSPVKTKKVKKAKAAKTGKRGRKANPNSANALRKAAIAARIAAGEKVTRGRKSDPNSASAQRKARLEALRKEGVVVRRGRPANPNKTVKVKKQRVTKASNPKSAPHIKLDNTNSVRVKGTTFITMMKAEKLSADNQVFCDFKSTLNHPSLGKMVRWNG